MPRRHLLTTALVALLPISGIALSAPAAEAVAPSAATVPGKVVVGFDPRTSGLRRAQARSAVSAVEVREMNERTHVLSVPGDPGSAARRLERIPGVDWAEPDYVVRATAVTPNDPLFPEQWALSNTGQSGGTAGVDVRARLAWELGQGSGMLVGVVDSGADPLGSGVRNDFVNVGEVGGNGIDDDGNGHIDDVSGWNFVADNADTSDDYGHGTEVSAVLAAEAGDGIGIAGLAPSATVAEAKALDEHGYGSTSGLAEAMDYLAGLGARVVNVSIGAPRSDAVTAAIEAHPGTLFVVAAGNDGLDNETAGDDATWPCVEQAPNVICVGSSTRTDALASFSNFGTSSVDLLAPGLGIRTTSLGGTEVTESGTSLSSPLVSATAILALAQRPSASVATLKAAILGRVVPTAGAAGRTVTGGRLDTLGPVLALQNQTDAPKVLEGPVITGSVSQGGSLFAQNGTWAPESVAVRRQWQRCDMGGGNCRDIGGATGSRLSLVAADIGSTVRLVTVGTGTGARSATAISATTGAVTPAVTVDAGTVTPTAPPETIQPHEAVVVAPAPAPAPVPAALPVPQVVAPSATAQRTRALTPVAPVATNRAAPTVSTPAPEVAATPTAIATPVTAATSLQVSSGWARLRLTCATGRRCRGTATVRQKVGHRTVTLGRSSFSLAARSSAQLKVRVGSRLKRKGAVTVRLQVGSRTVVRTLKVKR